MLDHSGSVDLLGLSGSKGVSGASLSMVVSKPDDIMFSVVIASA